MRRTQGRSITAARQRKAKLLASWKPGSRTQGKNAREEVARDQLHHRVTPRVTPRVTGTTPP